MSQLPTVDRKAGTRRQEQAAARREQLLAVTLDLFAERGVQGTAIRDIARAAGITEGLIYHYFPSKSALLRAVMDRYDCLPEMTEIAPILEGVPVREALIQMGLRFIELLARNRKYVIMIHTEAQRDPEVAQALSAFCSRGQDWAREFLERRIVTGELRPHDAAISIRLLHHSLLWFQVMEQTLSPPLDGESFVRGAIDVVLTGITASPDGAGCRAGVQPGNSG
jgi:AcrR family transcriptional regulator